MQWGSEHEVEARQEYANHSNNEIIPVGFVELNEYIGCSPDGLVGEDGLVEIKCPDTATHLIDYIKDQKLPTAYTKQIQGQLWITGRRWCDFVSWDPELPSIPTDLRYFCMRIERDEKAIAAIEGGVSLFIAELNEMITWFQGEF